MKSCPTCQRTFADATLNFCRFDGATLLPPPPLPLPPDGSSSDALQSTLFLPVPHSADLRSTDALPASATLLFNSTQPRRKRTSRKAIDSLAVLPFANTSGDPEFEYLADGMTESIINNLSQIPKLRVMARSTMFQYKNRAVEPQTVGQELNVRAVLVGRVLKKRGDLVVGMELVDIFDGSQLWSEQYQSKMSDLIETQEEIARQVTEKLRLKISNKHRQQLGKRYTENTAAYQLYLKGRYSWNKRTEEGLHKAVEFFEQAIKKDPHYALAYTGLADTFTMLSVYGGLEPGAAYSQAREAAVRALEIDDKLAEAHTSLAGVKEYYEWDFAGAERKYRRAIELNPRYSVAHHWYSHHLMAMGRFAEAVGEIDLAHELDPLSLSINVSVGLAFYWGHQFERAAEGFKKTLELDSSFALAHVLLGQTYGQQGRHEAAIEELQKARALDKTPQVNAILSHAYALSGRREEAEHLLAELDTLSNREYVPSYFIAAIYAALDQPDEAFRWLERAFEEHSAWLVWLKVDPKLDALHSDRRFAELLRRIGLAA